MQDQNFERQVRERMEEFSILPSVPVWQKVEAAIRRKRERRRLVLWLLPVLLAGGALGLLTTGDQPEKNSSAQTVETVTVNTSAPGVNGLAKEPTAPIAIEEENAFKGNESYGTGNPEATRNRTDYTGHTGRKKDREPALTAATPGLKKNGDEKRNLSPGTINTGNQPVTREQTTNETTASVTSGPVITGDRTDQKTAEAITPAGDLSAKDTEDPTAVTPVAPGKKRWQVSLQASAGLSQSVENIFPLTKAAESNVVTNSFGSSPPPQRTSPGIGRHFSAGAVFTTSLTSRVKLSTGMNYSYAGTVQKVGDKFLDSTLLGGLRDAAEPFVWQNSNSSAYKNHYHFIEIPVGFDFRLFSALPIDLHTGLSISRLLGSNSLHYAQDQNVYYRNNDHLQKTSVQLSGGFSYNLFRDRLKIGPQFRYSLLPLHNTGSQKNQHLMTAAIRARWSIN